MKRHGTTIILLIVLIIGLSLLLYPTFSDWWNSMHQSRAVASYVEQVANIDEEQYAHLWEAAWNYNESLVDRPNTYTLDEAQKAEYDQILDIGGLGIYIVKKSMDEISYEYKDGKNVLSIKKKL